MFSIKDYILTGMLVPAIAFSYFQMKRVESLQLQVTEASKLHLSTVEAYESILKVKPFEEVARLHKEFTNEEINSAVSSKSIIADATYRL